MRRLAGLAWLALALAVGPGCLACRPAAAWAAPSRAGQIAASCAACHLAREAPGQDGDGLRGHGIAALPGMDEAGIASALRDYRSGRRSGQIMQIVAGALSAAEIEAVADLVARQARGTGP